MSAARGRETIAHALYAALRRARRAQRLHEVLCERGVKTSEGGRAERAHDELRGDEEVASGWIERMESDWKAIRR